jgi:hypothetical protein
MYKSIECKKSIEDFVGHTRNKWRILGVSCFIIIFGLTTISLVSVFNSHFILGCTLLHNPKYNTSHMY